MANMSYCRFWNTRQDLADCINAMDDMLDFAGQYEELSDDEKRSMDRMAMLCEDFLARYEDIVKLKSENDA